jgi:hypothetical protein
MGVTSKIARFYLKNKIRYVLGTPVKLSFNERKLIVINKENKMLFSLLVKKTGTIEEKWKNKDINILQKNEIKKVFLELQNDLF